MLFTSNVLKDAEQLMDEVDAEKKEYTVVGVVRTA